jgi:hypothetical protein
LWRNRQTEAHLVLRPKPRNRRGDFEVQITKLELSVLRPNPGNPPPPRFWSSTKKPTTGFEAKPGETVATSFEAKLEKTIAAAFDAKPPKTVVTSFEAKPVKTVTTGFEAKPVKTVTTGYEAKSVKTARVVFEAKPLTNRRPWFWGSTKKPALLVSKCTVQTVTLWFWEDEIEASIRVHRMFKSHI